MATRLEQATRRLEAALARLEQAIASRTQGNGRDPEAEETLRRVQADYAALKDVTDTVSTRLDDAIHRLKDAISV